MVSLLLKYFYVKMYLLTFRAAPSRGQCDMTVAANRAILSVWAVTTVYFEASCMIDHRFVITAGSYFHTCG